MKSTLLLGACAALALSAFAMAPAANAADKAAVNPWSQCGIGAMIFTDNGTAAAISNVIWDLGTTAVTTSISSPDSCTGAPQKTAQLIGTTYAGLETDVAVGEGKYLTAVADTMGCSADIRSSLYAEVRMSFLDTAAKPEFIDMTKAQKAEALYNIVDKAVATGYSAKCTAV